MSPTIHLIGAPSSAGAYAPGQEKAPAAFRRHGLADAISGAGRLVRDKGDVAQFRWRPDRAHPKAMNVDAVHRTAVAVADEVAKVLADNGAAIVLGGDCTVELGTVAGALQGSSSVGLVYIDLDADLNTPETSDGALDWTGTAHLLGMEGTMPALAGLGVRRPMLGPADILFLGVENITPPEARAIGALGLAKIALSEVKANPVAAAMRALEWGSRFQRLLVHLDVDVVSYVDFAIAENVRRCDGLTLGELATVLDVILCAGNWRVLTITEVNPDHAPDEAQVFKQLIAVLANALRVRA
jgi:arginase